MTRLALLADLWPFKRKARGSQDLPGSVRVVSADVASSLPKPRVIYQDHRKFIGAQPLCLMNAMDLSYERYRNDDYRHCRIGKITMKG